MVIENRQETSLRLVMAAFAGGTRNYYSEPKAMVERLNNSHVYICSQDDIYWIAAAILSAGLFVPQPMPGFGVKFSCPRRS
jgi:hypothetical protein